MTEPAGTSPPIPSSVAARAVELRKIYGAGDATVTALDGVSIDFVAGQFTAVMGPSGSGKSTLMHILAGLDLPTTGTVSIAGLDITHMTDSELTQLRRDHIGFIFQFFNLLPMLTAEENILLPLRLAGEQVDSTWADERGAWSGTSTAPIDRIAMSAMSHS